MRDPDRNPTNQRAARQRDPAGVPEALAQAPTPDPLRQAAVSRSLAPPEGGEDPLRRLAPSLRAEAVLARQRTFGNAGVQRQLGSPASDPGVPMHRQPAATETDGQTAQPGLIVGDEVTTLAPGRMRQRDFLAELRPAVISAVADVLAGTAWSELAAPEIERRLADLRRLDAAAMERALRREVPAVAGAASAAAYVPIVCEHVRTQLRAQLAAEFGPADPIGAASGALADVAGAVSKAASSVAKAVKSAVGGALAAIGGLFFKRRPDVPRADADPTATRSRLGAGQALDGGVRAGMEAAFGRGFAAVRVHADGQAAALADELGARAFAVGEDVAFGAGEYRPGTPIGDALIAHELAHVAQQGGAAATGPLAKAEGGEGALEEEADRAAGAAVASLWGRTSAGLAGIKQNAMPRLRTGLSLQRCDKKADPLTPAKAAEARVAFRANHDHLTAEELDRIEAAIAAVTQENLDLQTSFYDYYTGHAIRKMDEAKAADYREKKGYAETWPGSDTEVLPEMLDAGFPASKLGTLLIHEYSHTRHVTGDIYGFGAFQEGDSYGIEFFLAERSGDTKRAEEILNVMRAPGGLVRREQEEELKKEFRTSYGTMVVLHEVIDGKSRDAPPLATPTPLTPDEARSFVAQLVSRKKENHDQRLQEIIAWVQGNFKSIEMPSLQPRGLPKPF
ncbi:MAG TPA: DUF4157 domain-containing protein [Thermomicrobiales bacterium]|jgi:hypothetical protein